MHLSPYQLSPQHGVIGGCDHITMRFSVSKLNKSLVDGHQDVLCSIDFGVAARECLCEGILKAWNERNGVLGNGEGLGWNLD